MEDSKQRILFMSEWGELLPTAEQVISQGKPAREYKKNLIGIGREYRDPRTGEKFPTDAARVSKWIETFGRMRDAGAPIPLVSHHGATDDPSDHYGYLRDVYVEDGWVTADILVEGEEALDAVERVRQVSIEWASDIEDGEGASFGEGLFRVACTNLPVAKGQKPFKVAASAIGEDAEVVCLSLEPIERKSNSKRKPRMNKEFITKMSSILGVDELDKDDVLEAVEHRITELDAQNSEMQEQIAELKFSLVEKSDALDKMKDEQGIEDDSVINAKRQLALSKADLLYASGRKPKEWVERFKSKVIGTGKGVRKAAFSASPNEDGRLGVLHEVLNLLMEEPQMVKFGVSSGAQIIDLPDGKKAETKDRMLWEEIVAKANKE